MPDLDLIKKAEQGCMCFGKAGPVISSRPATTNAGDFAPDMLQEHQTARRRFNE
ncbi:MAG: hypothetical protein WA840_02020 [Caulobacteraceae bacterium]